MSNLLKESLLGWGGYKTLQDKIYLDKQVVHLHGPYTESTSTEEGPFHCWRYTEEGNNDLLVYTIDIKPIIGSIVFIENSTNTAFVEKYTEPGIITVNGKNYIYDGIVYDKSFDVITNTCRMYSVNIDKTSSDVKFDIEIPYDGIKTHESFYTDKLTQCLVRIAYSEETNGIKRISMDLYNPNNGEHLQHEVVGGYSSASLSSNIIKVNAAQSLFSFYLNGKDVNGNVIHNPTLIIYSPKQKRVFEADVSEVIPFSTFSNINNEILGEVYNTNRDETLLDALVIPFVLQTTNSVYLYKLLANCETNPVLLYMSDEPIESSNKFLNESTEIYPHIPSTTYGVITGKSGSIYNYTNYNISMLNTTENHTEFSFDYNIRVHNTSLYSVNTQSYQNYATSRLEGLIFPKFESDNTWVGDYYTTNRAYMQGNGSDVGNTYSMEITPPSPGIMTRLPRFYPGPKYINGKKVLSEQGKLFTISTPTESFDFYKDSNAIVYAGIVKTSDSTGPDYTFDSVYIPVIISDSEEAVAGHIEDGEGNIYNSIITIHYRDKTYYASLCKPIDANSTISDNIYDVPVIYSTIELHTQSNSTTDWKNRIGLAALLVLETNEAIYYTTSTFVKDYYTNGTNYLSYKHIISGSFDTAITLALFNASTGVEESVVYTEQPIIPTSEKYIVITNVDQSIAQPPHYVTLLSLKSSNNTLYSQTELLDCNTNIEYRTDNSENLPVYTNGGFVIYPVAISDGELKDIPNLPEFLYAWTRNGLYLFTEAEDTTAVGTYVWLRTTENNFYKDLSSASAKVTSVNGDEMTVDGRVWTRASLYDYTRPIYSTIYQPVYLRGWKS